MRCSLSGRSDVSLQLCGAGAAGRRAWVAGQGLRQTPQHSKRIFAHTSSTHPARSTTNASTQIAQTATHLRSNASRPPSPPHFVSQQLPLRSGLLQVVGAGRARAAGEPSQAAATVGQACRQSPTASTQLHRRQRNHFQQLAGGPERILTWTSSSCCGCRCAPARCKWVGQAARGQRVSQQQAAGADRVNMTGDRQQKHRCGLLAPAATWALRHPNPPPPMVASRTRRRLCR